VDLFAELGFEELVAVCYCLLFCLLLIAYCLLLVACCLLLLIRYVLRTSSPGVARQLLTFLASPEGRDKKSKRLPGRPRQRTLVRRNTRQDFPTGNEDQERVNASNARFNFKTFTRGSPNKPHCGVSVCCCTNARILSAARPRSCATRAT